MEMYMQLSSDSAFVFFFPNPSKGIVRIEHILDSDASLLIKDSSGALIFEAKKMNAKKWDFSEFDAGEESIELSKGQNRLIRGLEVI
ncbi:MAG: T9SS type A sorting domain-containing protein [Flavobacteriales bacterium]|nr:T9SS type A sorting domain-containing protein [Flavobacteriales bacterium]